MRHAASLLLSFWLLSSTATALRNVFHIEAGGYTVSRTNKYSSWGVDLVYMDNTTVITDSWDSGTCIQYLVCVGWVGGWVSECVYLLYISVDILVFFDSP